MCVRCVCVCVCVFCKAHRKQMPALIRSSLLIFRKVMVSNHLENSWVMFDFLSRLCPCCVCVCVLQRANSGACTLPHSPSLCNWSQPSPVKNKNHLSAARVCPLKMHGGGSWGPLGKKADTRLSGRASEYQGGQMASSEKEGDGEGDWGWGWSEWVRMSVFWFFFFGWWNSQVVGSNIVSFSLWDEYYIQYIHLER